MGRGIAIGYVDQLLGGLPVDQWVSEATTVGWDSNWVG